MDNSKRYGGRTVLVNDAARIMGKSPQFIRIGLQRGILPFGTAFKTSEGNQQYDYYISPKLFEEYTGCKFGTVGSAEDSIVTANMLTSVNNKEV